jgi:hypothetical protein
VAGDEMRCLVLGKRNEAAAVRAAKQGFGAVEPVRVVRLGAADIDRERQSGLV